MTALGVYFAPTHGRQSDRGYIAALQPPVIRLLDPDVQQIADMHRLAPNAIIAPRTWVIDDHNGDAVRALMTNPGATGRDHAQQYRGQLVRWQSEALQRGLTLPPANRIVFNAANEPNQGGTPDKIAAYTIAFVNRCTELGIRAAALCLGVGWPDNTGPDTPVNWGPYNGIVEPIRRNGGWLELHEYFYKTGPQDGWRWLAGRHLQCPFDVPILLGEIGIDNYVDKARWDRDGGNRGWVGNVEPDVYAEMIERHIRGSDKRVVAALPFITDFRDGPSWFSFDTAAAHNALLARKERMIPQAQAQPASNGHNVHVPITGGPQPPPATQTAKPTNLAHPIADPAMRVLSQRFGANPAAYAPLGVRGHTGVDYAVPIGTPVRAVDTGMVLEALEDKDGWGKYVKVGHTWGQSIYAHLNRQDVQFGQVVQHGQVVGLSGNTGHSTGPHLHLGIRLNPIRRGASDPAGMDGWTDPLPYLQDAATSIWGIIQAAATEYGVDRYLLASLIWAESSFDPNAVSRRGAKGLGQLMPPTWDEWAGHVGARNPFDAKDNARVTAAYLGWLTRTLGNNTLKALHAYVWGIGRVMAGNTPPPEVVEYGTKILHGRDLLRAVLG